LSSTIIAEYDVLLALIADDARLRVRQFSAAWQL
jgi:hypothetical protein